jgi:hypothetical protein
VKTPQPLTRRAAEIVDLVLDHLGLDDPDPATLIAVAHYARLTDLAWRAAEELEAADALVAATDRGGERVDPAFSVMLRAEAAARQIGAAIGFEPIRKRRPGGQLGYFRAPDRMAGAAAPQRIRRVK